MRQFKRFEPTVISELYNQPSKFNNKYNLTTAYRRTPTKKSNMTATQESQQQKQPQAPTVNVVVSGANTEPSAPTEAKVLSKRQQRKLKQKEKKKGSNSQSDKLGLSQDVTATIKSTFGDTNNWMFLMVAAVLIISHKDDISGGIFGSYIDEAHMGNVGIWIKNNAMKTLGAVCLIPVIMALDESKRFKYASGALFSVLAAPAMELKDYILLAGAFHVAMHVKNKGNRMYILGAAFLYVYVYKQKHDLTELLAPARNSNSGQQPVQPSQQYSPTQQPQSPTKPIG